MHDATLLGVFRDGWAGCSGQSQAPRAVSPTLRIEKRMHVVCTTVAHIADDAYCYLYFFDFGMLVAS